MQGKLAGIVVLDLSSVGPASRATSVLADYGAEVVKVSAPVSSGAPVVEPPFFAYGGGRWTRRIALDLRSDEGREAFLALAVRADVVVESFRPGVADRLGIGYESVREVNPRVVYCSTSGYGRVGARSSWAGHDVDYLAVGGFLASTGRGKEETPPLPGATVADAAAGGMQAVIAIMAALIARATSGEGSYLDVSVAAGVSWLMSLAVDEALALGSDPGPGHDVLSGRYACYGIYRTADRRWVAVGAIEAKFFANLCEALGCPEWANRQYDDEAQDSIRSALAASFASRGRDEWVELLAHRDTCVAPVLTASEVAADPLTPTVEAKHPVRGSFRQLAPLLAGMVSPDEPVELSSTTATDCEELLIAVGYTPDRVARLKEQGVLA